MMVLRRNRNDGSGSKAAVRRPAIVRFRAPAAPQ
jgi:hypothetical protein